MRTLGLTLVLSATCFAVACGSSGAGGGDAGSPSGDGGSGTGLDARADGPVEGSGGGTDAPFDAVEGGASEAGPGSGDPTGVDAVAASVFLESLGVCAHVAQGVDDPTMSAAALVYAGIREMRDDGNPATVTSWIAMHQASGMRLSLLTNQDVAGTVGMAEQLNAAGALLAVEGPNEPNNFPVTYMGQTSDYTTTFVPVAELQRDLYAAVKADPALKGVPVFHSSEAGGSEPDNVGLQFLAIPAGAGIAMPDGTAYADYANTHNYVCGHSSDYADNAAWNASDPTLNGDWDGPYVEYGHTWHAGFAGYSNADLTTLPKVTTETGWVTSGTGAITLEQQGRLFLDLYLSAYKRGFAYTFIYMLRDDPVQGYWGLFDTGYNPKTSGTYVHNLTTILADTAAAAPGKLDYAIAAEPTTVHDLLLRKGNGHFDLVVWDEKLSGGTDNVTVDLTTSRPTVTVYDPTMGTAAVQTLNAVSSVPLTLSDHPVIVEI
ncbi:MAG TPA: hypothetical protein VGL81_22585 [Polyangiaceae bacterium]